MGGTQDNDKDCVPCSQSGVKIRWVKMFIEEHTDRQ